MAIVINPIIGGGGGGKGSALFVKLPKTGWSNNIQTISNIFFQTGNFAYKSAPLDTDAFGKNGVYFDEVAMEGQMKFHCKKVPSEDLFLYVLKEKIKIQGGV